MRYLDLNFFPLLDVNVHSSLLNFKSNIKVSKRKQEKFFSIIKDRANGKPVSRIIKKRNFWNDHTKTNCVLLEDVTGIVSAEFVSA